MDLGLHQKRALVLAGRRGLGRAVAQRLSQEGARVAITGRTLDRLQQTAAEIEGTTSNAVVPIMGDLGDAGDIERTCTEALATLGRIDILVLNAPGPKDGWFLNVGPEEWEAAINLNLMSAVRTLYHIVPHMQEQRSGRIIAITTVGVKQPLDALVLSCSIRLAVTGVMKTLATELAPYNILVNAVAPSLILAGANRENVDRILDTEETDLATIEARIAQDVPLGRFGTAEEFADVVAFLASERASYVTGATLQVDGGRYRGVL